MNNTNLTINFVNNEKSNIFIFYNDYFVNKNKYNNDANYANQMMFFTFSVTNNSNNQNINFLSGNDLTEMLILAKFYKFKKAVIQTPGHVTRSNFISNLENYIRDKNWLVIGHLLEYNNYIHLHDQCVVLNLENLQIDEIDPGEPTNSVLMPMYDRSEENFHDNYLPIWIKFNEKYSLVDVQMGWKWIAKGLINYSVLAFNEELRNSKIHLYPENKGHYETWNSKSNEENQLTKILKTIGGNRKLHLNNNEPCDIHKIISITNKKTFDNIVVLASGFYGLKMFKQFKPSNIIYYDILSEMLDIRKNIDSNWSGNLNNLAEFVNNKSAIFDAVPITDLFFEEIVKPEDVITTLEHYRKIKKNYYTVDIIGEVNKFLEIIPKVGITYIWLDSIYTYWHNIWKYKPHNIQKSYEMLIDGLSKHENEIWLDIKEPTGSKKIFEVHNYAKNNTFSSGYDYWS